MPNSNKPFISIIIATLNADNVLERCLKSVISQSYHNFELIIKDGNSTDNTRSIISKYSSNISFSMSEPDTGIYNAWNKALAHAKGEWICFLGADDYFSSSLILEKLAPYLNDARFSGIRVVYGKVARINNKGQTLQVWGKPWHKNRRQMRHGMPIGLPHTGLMHHIDLFNEHGYFNDNLKLAGDYEFLLRELKHKKRKAFFVDDLITVAQQIGGTVDSNTFAFHKEVAQARKINGLPRFSWFWWLIHIRTFLRHKLRLL
ncbi:MAG: glycosyltransferase [Desulfobacterales bacterium]|nr:glycosyltransferase [Desulfobacterales bacterium]